jgi:hypothetical protein
MVGGLTIFRDRFRGLEDCYVLIGGTACDLRQFAAGFPADAGEWRAIGQAVANFPEPPALLAQLRDVFTLGG